MPYTIIHLVILYFDIYMPDFTVMDWLYRFSTFSFWVHHNADWYIALLIPLYLITPLLYSILDRSKNRIIMGIVLVILLMIVCHLNIDEFTGVSHNLLENIQGAFKRVVCFILGMAIAPYVKEKKKIDSWMTTVIFIFIFVAFKILLKDVFINWLLVPMILIVSCSLLKKTNKDKHFYLFLTWIGTASLESYLSNVGVKAVVGNFVPEFHCGSLFYGHYIDYLMVIMIGLVLTYYAHKLSQSLIKKIRI